MDTRECFTWIHLSSPVFFVENICSYSETVWGSADVEEVLNGPIRSGGSSCLQSGQMWSADCSEEALCYLHYVSLPAADSINGSSSEAVQSAGSLCPLSCSAPCSWNTAPAYTEIEILSWFNSWLCYSALPNNLISWCKYLNWDIVNYNWSCCLNSLELKWSDSSAAVLIIDWSFVVF